MAARLTTGWLPAFWAATRRELAHWRGDRWELLLVTALPLLLMALMAWLFSASVMRGIPVALVDLDGSTVSRELTRAIDASPGVTVAMRSRELAQAQAGLRSLDVYAVVLLPAGTERRVLRGEEAPVQVLYNATWLATGQAASRELADALNAAGAQLSRGRIGRQAGPAGLRAPPVRVQATVLHNPARSFELFLLPLIFPAMLSLLAALAVGGAVGRERRDGTLAAWLGARPWLAIAGKLCPYVALFSLYGAIGVAYVAGVRGGGIAGSAVLLLLAQPLFYLACAAFALLFLAAAPDMATGMSLVGLVVGTALAFSGATFPVIDAPLFARVWNALLPLTAYVQLQMEQQFMGAPVAVSLRPLAVLVAMAAVPVALAGWRLRRIAGADGTAAAAGELRP